MRSLLLQRLKGSFRNTLRATPRLIVHCDGVDELADVLSPGESCDANPVRDANWDGIVSMQLRPMLMQLEQSDVTETSVDATRMTGGSTSACAKGDAKKRKRGEEARREFTEERAEFVGPPHENEKLTTPL